MGCGGSSSGGASSPTSDQENSTARQKGGAQNGNANKNSPNKASQGGKGAKYETQSNGTANGSAVQHSEANDKGYKKRVREKLRLATAGSDIQELEKMIGQFERSHLEDCGDLTKANDKLKYLKLKLDLRDALRRRHVGVLEKTISDARSSEYEGQLQSQIEAAERLRDHLKELNRYNHDILQMEQTTISELHSYHRPPSCVHDVMAATYMLLGEDEAQLSEWPDIQAHLGKLSRDSLIRKVEFFDSNDVDEQRTARVKEILDYHDLDEVRQASNGAGTFFVWSSQIVDKISNDKQQEEDRKKQEEEEQQQQAQQSQASAKGRKKKG